MTRMLLKRTTDIFAQDVGARTTILMVRILLKRNKLLAKLPGQRLIY